ncbi:hypothetical protein [Thalassovita sp.]|nr:hypothetical protein [Thalassovita sp.]
MIFAVFGLMMGALLVAFDGGSDSEDDTDDARADGTDAEEVLTGNAQAA